MQFHTLIFKNFQVFGKMNSLQWTQKVKEFSNSLYKQVLDKRTTLNILQPKRQKKLPDYLIFICLGYVFHNSPLDGSLTTLHFCISFYNMLKLLDPRSTASGNFAQNKWKSISTCGLQVCMCKCPPKTVNFSFHAK